MLRYLIGLCLLSSCSMGVVSSGGDRTYVYDVYSDYSSENLKELAPQIVISKHRDPPKGELKELFSKQQKPIKRVGILVFESVIQSTRSGLSNEDKIFVSEQGKQLMTEKLLSMWDQSFPILGVELKYVPTAKIQKGQALLKYGDEVTDYIKSKRTRMAPDDIFYLPPGKKTAVATTLNPRGMRDLSLALVPASELMEGPKFSEHMKHALNDVAKELELDAMFVVMNEISWTASHIDKHSGEMIPEEVKIKIKSSTLIPLSDYHQRLIKAGEKRDLPNTTIAYRSYEGALSIPVLITVGEQDQNFEHIEKEVLDPMLKTYKDLSQMVLVEMIRDIKLTH